MNKLLSNIRKIYAHYQSKLFVAFLLCTFLPICLIAGVSYWESYNIAKKQIVDAALFSSEQTGSQINAHISQAEKVADALQYNMYTLMHSKQVRASDYIDIFTETRNSIGLFESSFNFYHIYVFLPDLQLGSEESVYFFPLSELSDWGISENDFEDLGTSSLWVTTTDTKLPYYLKSGKGSPNGIACCRAEYNKESRRLDYAFMIIISEDALLQSMNYTDSSNIRTCILSENNTIVASTDNDYVPQISYDEALAHANTGKMICSTNSFTYLSTALSNGWYLITEIPKDYIFRSTLGIIRWILLTVLLFIPFTSLIVLYYVRSLSFKVKALSDAMDNYNLQTADGVSGKIIYELPKDKVDYDEIDKLCISFANMQDSISSSLNSIVNYRINEEKLKYQLLQSQINPHFLYNILGSIKYCQSLGKLDDAGQMLTDLTKFYRLSLRKSGDLIPLRDELEIAEAYLRLEKLCRRGVLTWTIDLEDGIENFPICKFTIQPFLENAILHGITDASPDLDIRITASYGDSTVILEITDNGCGIDKGTLEEINRSLRENSVRYDHFGVSNVNARISSPYYGNGHITIDSEEGNGTCVCITYDQMELEE